MMDFKTPSELRLAIRAGSYQAPTPGLVPGYAQANLVVLPKILAYDFLLFCQRNPKPCPVLEVTDIGNPEAYRSSPGSDLRFDIPKYRIYEYGELTGEVADIKDYWQKDSVGFLIGCSFTFEKALSNAKVPIRHIECGCNVPMYKTNIPCVTAGMFSGNMVVSMRPIPNAQIIRAVQVTSRYPSVHGAPIHIGDPGAIGIQNLHETDFGDPVPINDGETPVFWACGVTPQLIAMVSKPPLMITHAPGHMFVTDIWDETLAVI
jgi:uncharacterized protein YcsI (UPF0317 family)